MAKKRKSGKKASRPATPPQPTTKPEPTIKPREAIAKPAPEPAFWFGFEVSWAKLVAARVVLFGLLACDALLQLRHASRYGAGGFYVAQLPGLDAIGPTRALYASAELINAYLFVLIACGVGTRALVPFAATIYAWLYFGSQLDSFQHHYLIALVLVIACFVPWRRPPGATATTRVRAWALRVMLVQLGVMYLWAAISKMNHAWVDGRTLVGQVAGVVRPLIEHTVGLKTASKMVIGVELLLAFTVWMPRAWIVAAPLGILFHLSIALSGLEIGLFAVLMLGFYVLVLPDRLWTGLASFGAWLLAATRIDRLTSAIERAGGAGLAIAMVGGLALAAVCRFGATSSIAIAITIVVIVVGILSLRGPVLGRLAIAHVLAFGTWVVVDRASSIAADYYKFWGGASRRFKDVPAAEAAYRRLIEIAPEQPTGYYLLGRIMLENDVVDDGLAQLHLAQARDPDHARTFVYEARWLATHKRTDEAIAKARAATAADPNDADAKALLASLLDGKKPTLQPRDDREVP